MSSQAQGLLCQYLSEDMSGINLGTLDLPEIEKDLVKIPNIDLEIPIYALKTKMHFSPANKLEDKINSLFT